VSFAVSAASALLSVVFVLFPALDVSVLFPHPPIIVAAIAIVNTAAIIFLFIIFSSKF
jgi:hypothetical protein